MNSLRIHESPKPRLRAEQLARVFVRAIKSVWAHLVRPGARACPAILLRRRSAQPLPPNPPRPEHPGANWAHAPFCHPAQTSASGFGAAGLRISANQIECGRIQPIGAHDLASLPPSPPEASPPHKSRIIAVAASTPEGVQAGSIPRSNR